MSEKQTCCGSVWRGFATHSRCVRSAAYEHEGKWYCKTHHPPTDQAKRDAKHAAWELAYAEKCAKSATRQAEAEEQQRRADLYPELLEALQDLMAWQIKHVDRWHNNAYDNAARIVTKATGATP